LRAQDDADASLDELMVAYAEGDDRRFEALYDGLSPRLESFLRRRGIRDQSRVEDIVQQTFLHIHAARGHFLPGAQVLPWAFRIARNAMLDTQHKARREQSENLTDEANVHFSQLVAAPDAEQVLHAKELGIQLEAVCSGVPEPQRLAFELVKKRGLSAREAAAQLGTTVTGVRLRLHRFYQAVRLALRDDPEEPELAITEGDRS
jgi:RNA polymerase sigma-70 factor (ECF subfamily)